MELLTPERQQLQSEKGGSRRRHLTVFTSGERP